MARHFRVPRGLFVSPTASGSGLGYFGVQKSLPAHRVLQQEGIRARRQVGVRSPNCADGIDARQEGTGRARGEASDPRQTRRRIAASVTSSPHHRRLQRARGSKVGGARGHRARKDQSGGDCRAATGEPDHVRVSRKRRRMSTLPCRHLNIGE